MSLSKQEAHCIELACEYLSSIFGGKWVVKSLLDELYDKERIALKPEKFDKDSLIN